MLTGIPLLHYFQCKNEYSGAHFGMRYHFKPGKRKESQSDGSEKEVPVLTGTVWPDPWALEKTDPALRMVKEFPLSDAGLAQAQQWIEACYYADEVRWNNCPGILDCEPWSPPDESGNKA